VSRARNECVAKFLQESDADYLFTLDDDIAIPPNAFVDLIDADKDMIGGIYRLKSEDDSKLAARALYDIDVDKAVKEKEIHPMIYVSTGCILHKRSFIETMWNEYEDLRYVANMVEPPNNERRALYLPFIHRDEYLSEDWAFCQRAKEKGFEIYAHFGVPCGHWGLKEYTMWSA
jgi:hypothetical protein